MAPQLGQAWQLPARCMMSPHTWQSTTSCFAASASRAPAARPPTAARLTARVGRRPVLGRQRASMPARRPTVASSTPGSVGCVRSPIVSTPISTRSS